MPVTTWYLVHVKININCCVLEHLLILTFRLERWGDDDEESVVSVYVTNYFYEQINDDDDDDDDRWWRQRRLLHINDGANAPWKK